MTVLFFNVIFNTKRSSHGRTLIKNNKRDFVVIVTACCNERKIETTESIYLYNLSNKLYIEVAVFVLKTYTSPFKLCIPVIYIHVYHFTVAEEKCKIIQTYTTRILTIVKKCTICWSKIWLPS